MSLGLADGPAYDGGRGSAVSADGNTVYGAMFFVPGGERPFRYTDEAGYTVFNEEEIIGLGARVRDVSLDQRVFIGRVFTGGFGGPFDTAYRWTQERGFEHLLDVVSSPGLTGDQAFGISADGNIIVGAIAIQNEPQPEDMIAAIWDETRGWRRIEQILIDSGIDMTGWSLFTAADISDDGRIVVGTGINPDGHGEAWLVDLSNPTLLQGDYNADQVVEQTDLDLVLLHWGADASLPPDGWIRNLPSGLVDQAELDSVLLNWGMTQPQATALAIPEPASMRVLIIVIGVLLGCRRMRFRFKKPTIS
jgi:uncharacterized membrane protein